MTKQSVIDVIAPSHVVNREQLRAGADRLGGRYRLRISDKLFRQKWFLAGSDDERLAELRAALASDSAAIWSARGGYGAARLAPHSSLDEVRAARKTLIGFSDTTVLHALWARAGLQSIHGPMLSTLGHASGETLSSLFGALEGETPQPIRGLACWSRGQASGPLVGGNLSVLSSLVGTGLEPPLDGAVLLLEEVGERAYRVDRMLTQLRQAGWFERVAAVVLGWFVPVQEVVPLEPVLRDRFEKIDIPVLAKLPVGHAEPNLSLALGAAVHVDAENGTLTFAS